MAVIHFRTLESEPGRDPYLGTTKKRRQGIIANLDRPEDLQMQADPISMPGQSGYEITPHMTAGSGDGERGRRFEDKDPGSTALGPSPAKNFECWRQGRLTENDKVAGSVRPLTRRNNDAE
jgi:hypothetical protein